MEAFNMGVTRERMTILKVQYDPKYTKEEDPSLFSKLDCT